MAALLPAHFQIIAMAVDQRGARMLLALRCPHRQGEARRRSRRVL